MISQYMKVGELPMWGIWRERKYTIGLVLALSLRKAEMKRRHLLKESRERTSKKTRKSSQSQEGD